MAGGVPAPIPHLSVVVPVYNELSNVEPLVRRTCSALDNLGRSWELILVDDGSTDGSAEALELLAGDRDGLRVLHFEENCGQSAALAAGFSHARGELIALLDADLQTYPEDLPALVHALERDDVDAVVGIRADRQDTGWKRFTSWFANGVRNRLTREDVIDTGCPLKVFRRSAVSGVVSFNGMHRFLPTLLRLEGYQVRQLEIRHARRRYGVSKYGTWDRALRGFRDALGVRWLQDRHLRWQLRPKEDTDDGES